MLTFNHIRFLGRNMKEKQLFLYFNSGNPLMFEVEKSTLQLMSYGLSSSFGCEVLLF